MNIRNNMCRIFRGRTLVFEIFFKIQMLRFYRRSKKLTRTRVEPGIILNHPWFNLEKFGFFIFIFTNHHGIDNITRR